MEMPSLRLLPVAHRHGEAQERRALHDQLLCLLGLLGNVPEPRPIQRAQRGSAEYRNAAGRGAAGATPLVARVNGVRYGAACDLESKGPKLIQ